MEDDIQHGHGGFHNRFLVHLALYRASKDQGEHVLALQLLILVFSNLSTIPRGLDMVVLGGPITSPRSYFPQDALWRNQGETRGEKAVKGARDEPPEAPHNHIRGQVEA